MNKFMMKVEYGDESIKALNCAKKTSISCECDADSTLSEILETIKTFLIAMGYSAFLVESISITEKR